MNTNDFDYKLPIEFIAQHPLENRSESKLLIMNKYNGNITHKHFRDILDYFTKSDVLVLNNTKVLPARIYTLKEETNAKIEVLLLKEIKKDVWQCLVKPQKRVKKGTILKANDSLSCKVLEIFEDGITNIKMIYTGIFIEELNKCGVMPLPPYIHEKLKDNDRYQTVYASMLGSVAAPTAGLHFTEEILNNLKEKGVTIVYITLHVGIGTFRPVSVNDVTKHKMHSEYYEISEDVAEILNRSKNEGKRIVCVGTTSVRTLESNYTKYNCFKSTKEETDIFIYPGYKFKACEALITNFHLPKSTLLMLVSAFSKKEYILKAYDEAINNNYRFFSFGDAMFINNSSINSRNEYNELLKEFKTKKNVLKKDNFKIYKGTNNVILSAPHSFKQLRNECYKKNEYNTGKIAKLLNIMKSCHMIYTYKEMDTDHNYYDTNYRKELSKYVKENNIKYMIDIHGIEKNSKYDLILGTNNYNNVNNDEDLILNIQKIFKNNLSSKVYIDKIYKSTTNTISSYINKENGIKTIQIEIGKNYRKYNKRPISFNKLINSFIKVIELLERWDKNE